MVDFIDEVNEEMRRERAAALWKRVGGYVIGVSIAVVAVTAGGVLWEGYKQSRQEAAATEYFAAEKLRVARQNAEADAAFAKLVQGNAEGFPELAKLKQASTLREAGKVDEAVALYLNLANDKKADEGLRAFARIYAAQALSEFNKPFAEIETVLRPLISVKSSPFAPLAKEQLAFSALGAGDAATAQRLLEEITADTNASPMLKQRAGVQAVSLAASSAANGS